MLHHHARSMMNATPDIQHVPSLLREAAGAAQRLNAAAPARITVREAARWLGVSPPTAARVLAGNRELQTTGLVSITALAELAAPWTASLAAGLHVAVMDTHAGAGALRMAAGLAQGLGIMGCRTRLLDDSRSSFLREHFGAAWPGALLCTDDDAPPVATQYARVWIAEESCRAQGATLILVPCPVTPRGLRDAADVLADVLHATQGTCRIRLLPWGDALAIPAVADHQWDMFAQVELQEGGVWLPLSKPPASVPPRQALALRVAIAMLTRAVLTTVDAPSNASDYPHAAHTASS